MEEDKCSESGSDRSERSGFSLTALRPDDLPLSRNQTAEERANQRDYMLIQEEEVRRKRVQELEHRMELWTCDEIQKIEKQ